MKKQREPYALLVGRQNGMAILGNRIVVPQKLKIEPLYDPAISLLDINLKELK